MLVALDTETTGLVPWGDPKRLGYYPPRPFAISWCDEDETTHFVRFPVNPKTRKVLYQLNPAGFERVQEIVGDSRTTLILFNAPFDLRHLRAAGFTVCANYVDTKTMTKIATGGIELQYSLKTLTNKYFKGEFSTGKSSSDPLHKSTVSARRKAKKRGWCIATKELGFGTTPVYADMWMADADLLEEYSREDALRTLYLYHFSKNMIDEDEGLTEAHELEVSMNPVFQSMEVRGTHVILDNAVELEDYYQNHLNTWKQVITDHGYPDLNINSPQQLVDLFIEDKGYPILRHTETGNASVNNDVLEQYARVHKDPVATAIQEWKIADKGLNGFVFPYQRFATPDSNGVPILHPDYDPTGAVTARISCRDPNLMQVADAKKNKNTIVKNRAREMLGPRPGHYWYLFDYSQIEVWLFAFLAQSEMMMKALLDGHDFHAFNAETIWGKFDDFKEHFDNYRKRGKIIMFTKLYGGGVSKVAEQIGCSVEKARDFVDQFENRLPDVPRFINRMLTSAERDGFIRNPFGRIYNFHHGTEYKAVNYEIQGSAAEIMKRSMLAVFLYLIKREPTVHLLLTIHDELVVEVPEEIHFSHGGQLMRDIRYEMQHEHKRVSIPVRFPIDIEITRTTWNNKRKVRLAA